MLRDEILEAARKCVSGERDRQYGGPENNFALIAALWDVYLTARPVDPSGVPRGLRASDVAAMMALLKIARVATGSQGKSDNWIDLAGYAACGGEIQTAYHS